MKKNDDSDILCNKRKQNIMRKVFELADKGLNVEVKKAPRGEGYKISTVNKREVDIEAE